MIPFLRKDKEASVSMPASTIKRDPDNPEEDYDGLTIAAEDLCHAIEKKDYKAIAEAIRAAFELCDMAPHEEGPHTNG